MKELKRRRLCADDRFEMDLKHKKFVAVGEGLRYVSWGIFAFVALAFISVTALGLLVFAGKPYAAEWLARIAAL